MPVTWPLQVTNHLPTRLRWDCSSSYLTAEKAMAPHSSILAWKIPWMEKPGRLQSTGSLKVGHDWATSLSLFTLLHWRRKWQPTPVFLPGEFQGRGSLVAAIYGVTQSRTRLKWLSSSSISFSINNCWTLVLESLPGCGGAQVEYVF